MNEAPQFTGASRRQGGRPDERPERMQLPTRSALLEEERGVGLGPGEGVRVGVDDPPLAPVREERDRAVGPTQPLHRAGRRAAPMTYGQALDGVVDEDRQDRVVRAHPDAPGLDVLARDRTVRPGCAHVGALQPMRSREADHVLEDGVEQLTQIPAVQVTAEPVGDIAGQRRQCVAEVLGHPLGRQQQAPMRERGPPVRVDRECHARPPAFEAVDRVSSGKRISTATGNT